MIYRKTALGLVSSYTRLKEHLNGKGSKKKTLFIGHRIIVQNFFGLIVDLPCIALLLLHLPCVWRFGLSIYSINDNFGVLKRLAKERGVPNGREQVFYSAINTVREDVIGNLFLSACDLVAGAICILSLVTVWRFYYQMFIVRTLIQQKRSVAAKELCISELRSKMNMWVVCEFLLLLSLLLDLLVTPFMLIDIVSIWKIFKLRQSLRVTKHDHFSRHRALVFLHAVDILCSILFALSRVLMFVTALRFPTYNKCQELARLDLTSRTKAASISLYTAYEYDHLVNAVSRKLLFRPLLNTDHL